MFDFRYSKEQLASLKPTLEDLYIFFIPTPSMKSEQMLHSTLEAVEFAKPQRVLGFGISVGLFIGETDVESWPGREGAKREKGAGSLGRTRE